MACDDEVTAGERTREREVVGGESGSEEVRQSVVEDPVAFWSEGGQHRFGFAFLDEPYPVGEQMEEARDLRKPEGGEGFGELGEEEGSSDRLVEGGLTWTVTTVAFVTERIG